MQKNIVKKKTISLLYKVNILLSQKLENKSLKIVNAAKVVLQTISIYEYCIGNIVIISYCKQITKNETRNIVSLEKGIENLTFKKIIILKDKFIIKEV